MDCCSPPGSSIHGISQARILEWVAVSFSGALPAPEIEPRSPHCKWTRYHLSHQVAFYFFFFLNFVYNFNKRVGIFYYLKISFPFLFFLSAFFLNFILFLNFT